MTSSAFHMSHNLDNAVIQLHRPIGEIFSQLGERLIDEDLTIEMVKSDHYSRFASVIERILKELHSHFTEKDIIDHMKYLDEHEFKESTDKDFNLTLETKKLWKQFWRARHLDNSLESAKYLRDFAQKMIAQNKININQTKSNKQIFSGMFLSSNYDSGIHKRLVSSTYWICLSSEFINNILENGIKKIPRPIPGARISLRTIDEITNSFINYNKEIGPLVDSLVDEQVILLLAMDLPNCEKIQDLFKMKPLTKDKMNLTLISQLLDIIEYKRVQLATSICTIGNQFCRDYGSTEDDGVRLFREFALNNLSIE